MIIRLFAVRDEKVEAFMPVFSARARGEAIRSFSQAVGDANHQFSKSKGDYVLYEIGGYDDVAGMLVPQEPIRLMSGFEAVGPDDLTGRN